MTDRQIAEATHVDHKTVAKIREERDVGNSSRPDGEPETTDTMGRQQPAKKSQKAKKGSKETDADPDRGGRRSEIRTRA